MPPLGEAGGLAPPWPHPAGHADLERTPLHCSPPRRPGTASDARLMECEMTADRHRTARYAEADFPPCATSTRRQPRTEVAKQGQRQQARNAARGPTNKRMLREVERYMSSMMASGDIVISQALKKRHTLMDRTLRANPSELGANEKGIKISLQRHRSTGTVHRSTVS